MDFGSILGGAVVDGFVGNLFGGGRRSGMSTSDKQFQLDMVRLGNREDLRNQNLAYDHRLTRMKEYGLTPTEMFGSPASGSGGGTSGTGSTLGNMASQQAMQASQQRQERNQQMRQLAATLSTDLAKTKMQTDTQKEVAELQTGATTRGQDINMKIAQNVLELDRDKLDLEVKKANSLIGMQDQKTAKLINEVATSDPKFQLFMKQLSMGKENLLVELTMQHEGINIQGDFKNLPKEKRQAIINRLIALSSTVYQEGSGVKAVAEQAVEASKRTTEALKTIIEALAEMAGNKIAKESNSRTSNDGVSLGTGNSPVPPGTPLYDNYSIDFPGR